MKTAHTERDVSLTMRSFCDIFRWWLQCCPGRRGDRNETALGVDCFALIGLWRLVCLHHHRTATRQRHEILAPEADRDSKYFAIHCTRKGVLSQSALQLQFPPSKSLSKGVAAIPIYSSAAQQRPFEIETRGNQKRYIHLYKTPADFRFLKWSTVMIRLLGWALP
jgi:hypothetical protein